jgi:hypothetical protein
LQPALLKKQEKQAKLKSESHGAEKKKKTKEKILEFQAPDVQPVWAERMEERLADKFDAVAESVHVLEQRMTDLHR